MKNQCEVKALRPLHTSIGKSDRSLKQAPPTDSPAGTLRKSAKCGGVAHLISTSELPGTTDIDGIFHEGAD
jgi:hypothetical protein